MPADELAKGRRQHVCAVEFIPALSTLSATNTSTRTVAEVGLYTLKFTSKVEDHRCGAHDHLSYPLQSGLNQSNFENPGPLGIFMVH